MTSSAESMLADRLKADLRLALKARDRVAVSALRTAIAALANAEAPTFDATEHREGRGELVEHHRLVLGSADARAVVLGEIERREALLADHGDLDPDSTYIQDLRAEVAVLRPYLR